MDSFQDLFKKKNMGELLLAILFIVYLIMGYPTPTILANVIGTSYGTVVVILIALLLFAYTNPILGVLAFFVAYNLINSSSNGNSSSSNAGMPTEQQKYSEMTSYNQYPYTLEQEMVTKMAPLNSSDPSKTDKYTFNPVLDDQHSASSLNEVGAL
jgi:hypothetical protein